MYQFNQLNPDIDKPYNMPEYFRGLYLDWHLGSPKGGFIIGWTNKHLVANAEGIATGSGEVDYNKRKIKARFNMLNLGFYFALIKRVKMGMTFDMGNFKVRKKIGLKSDYDNADWVNMYDEKGNFIGGLTMHICFPIKISERVALRFQPYAQWIGFLDYPEYTTTYTNKYYYNISNFGINTYLSFMKSK